MARNTMKTPFKNDISLKEVKVCILGQNEVFGIEEIIENRPDFKKR